MSSEKQARRFAITITGASGAHRQVAELTEHEIQNHGEEVEVST